MTCFLCNGRGSIPVEHEAGGMLTETRETCPECRGTGGYMDPDEARLNAQGRYL